MSVSSFPNGFTAALPTLSQAMNTKNYKALCVQGTIYNLIIKDWHLKGMPMNKRGKSESESQNKYKSQPGCRASRGSTQ
jgi:hypothetical protein